jgi:hypothetical protein
MLETPHVAVGVAIASKIPNPFIAVPLAFASHFVLEMVPHWNPHINTDSTLALIFGSFVAYQALPNTGHAITILAASLASILPDLIEAPHFFLKMDSKFIPKWIAFQKIIQSDTTLFWGLLTQLATIGAAILWIRN